MWKVKFFHACRKCFRKGNPIGLVLIILGTIILALAIPTWFWVAAIGAGLLCLGYWLYEKFM